MVRDQELSVGQVFRDMGLGETAGVISLWPVLGVNRSGYYATRVGA